MERPALGPILLWLVGWSLGALSLEVMDARRMHRSLQGVGGPDWDIRDVQGGRSSPAPYPRWLRQARGVGRRRSVDLARYLWKEGVDAPPEALRGIGAKTGASVRSALAELGALEPGSRRTSSPAGHAGR